MDYFVLQLTKSYMIDLIILELLVYFNFVLTITLYITTRKEFINLKHLKVYRMS